jgi:hypothetical protein
MDRKLILGTREVKQPIYSVLAKQILPLHGGSALPSPLSSSKLHASDLCAWKPGSQITMTARAYAPKGRPVRELTASIQTQDRIYSARVYGDRTIQCDRKSLHLSIPAFFVEQRMDLGRSFGGFSHGMPYPPNPIGTGFHLRKTAKELANTPLPCVEDPKHPLALLHLNIDKPADWKYLPKPRHFGFLPSQFYPRNKYLKGMHPNPRGYFTAPEGLCFERHMEPGEEIILKNCHRHHAQLVIALPRANPSAWIRINGREFAKSMNMQDVHIDCMKETLTILWRASFTRFQQDQEVKEYGIIHCS